MKTEDGNEALHPWIAPELEARLAALVLGEASDFERDELERLIAERPELELYRKRLETMHRMLREVASGESGEGQGEWKLAPERRAAVLALLKGDGAVEEEVVVVSVSKRQMPWGMVLRIAACVAVIALVLGLIFPATTGLRKAGKPAAGSLAFANDHGGERGSDLVRFQPAQREWQVYPGYPAASWDTPKASGLIDPGLFDRAQSEWKPYPAASSSPMEADRETHEMALADSAIRPPISTTATPALAAPMVVTRSGQAGALNETVALGAGGDVLSSADPNSLSKLTADRAAGESASVRVGGGFDARTTRPESAEPYINQPEEGNANSLGLPTILEGGDARRARHRGVEEQDVAAAEAGMARNWAYAAPESSPLARADSITEAPHKGHGQVTSIVPAADAADGPQRAEALGERLRAEEPGMAAAAERGAEVDLALAPEVVEFDGFINYGAGVSQVDPSVRDILALTPHLSHSADDAGRIAGDNLQASTGTRGLRSGTVALSSLDVPTETFLRGGDPNLPDSPPVKLDYGAPLDLDGDALSTEGRISSGENVSSRTFAIVGHGGRTSVGDSTDYTIIGDRDQKSAAEPAPRLRQPTPSALGEISPAAEPFSTFSLHVSEVSFQLAKAALAAGRWPEAGQIRLEEFVNAFDYGDPVPSMGERVAARIDQAAHPFLQQRQLVRIALRTAEAGRSATTPLRLTLLLDNSGSMERPDRRETVRRAVATLTGLLGENDRVTLVSFARQPRLVADAVPGHEATKLAEIVAALPSEGGTNLEAALLLAFEKAREHREAGAQNRVVLLTDGAANLGNAKPEGLAQLVEAMRGSGIAFDAAGIGAEGLNDEILEALARKGDGRYFLLDRPEDAEETFAKQIAGALRPAAQNVKVQVEFNPGRVKSYKLLGFEKHRLATEDFRNDAVDAAELAAAEAGVAVYQVEPDPAGEGDLGSVSVRFRDLDSGEMVERRWPLPHLPSAPLAEQGGEAILLATVASQFAAKLAGGPLGDVVDLAELARLAAGLPDSPRVKELREMIEQARGLEGARE